MKRAIFPEHIFREYDIRGIVGKEITEELAFQIGAAFAAYISKQGLKTICVGRDCRLSSEALTEAVKKGIRSFGLNVVDLGLVPTPLVYFSMYSESGIDAGISITGSHNPAEYNGFKFCSKSGALQKMDFQILYQEIKRGAKHGASGGSVRYWSPIESYVEWVKKDIPSFLGLSIIVDAGNGATAECAPLLYEALGCKVERLFCTFDGTFPNHFPDPTLPENLVSLCNRVGNATVGLAFDGDGDRLGIVTDDGRVLAGDLLLCIFARDLLTRHPGAKIIGDVKCSNLLFRDVARRGGVPIMWKTGHSLIKRKLVSENALLAGEMSGHYFFADRFYGFDDALYAGARLLEILYHSKKRVAELVSDIPQTVATPEIRINCADSEKFEVVKEVSRLLATKYEADTLDGIRISFNETDWALVRPSNTQPVIVMRFEAASSNRLLQIQETIESALREARASLQNMG